MQALTCQGKGKAGRGRIRLGLDIFMGPCLAIDFGFGFSRLRLVPDLALYSVPVALLRLGDVFSLQLLEHSSACWQRAVDITQKSLRVGVTVSDKAVIQLLQLIRKTILVAQRRHVSFRDTIESCCRRRLIVCVCIVMAEACWQGAVVKQPDQYSHVSH